MTWIMRGPKLLKLVARLAPEKMQLIFTPDIHMFVMYMFVTLSYIPYMHLLDRFLLRDVSTLLPEMPFKSDEKSGKIGRAFPDYGF